MSRLAQLGLVGYDQRQVSSDGGTYLVAGFPVAASSVPYYSVHGIGVQAGPEDLRAPVRDEVKKEIVTCMHRKPCTQN
jgi:hypothetical protein